MKKLLSLLLCVLLLTALITACGDDTKKGKSPLENIEDSLSSQVDAVESLNNALNSTTANSNGGTITTSHSTNDGHGHGNTDADKVKYQIYTNSDKTYRLVIRDNENEIVFEKDKIERQPIKETMNEEKGVYEIGWATGNGPNDYECVYYNVKTGQLSAVFVAPRGCDGTRIAYGSEDQKKVIVQDLFDKDAYYKEYELKNTKVDKNGDIIVGGRLHENKKTVIVSYNSTETESSAHATFELYE